MSTFDLPTDPTDPRIPRLLALARTPRLRLLDVLLEALREAPEGPAARLEALLAEGPAGELGAPRALFVEGRAGLAELVLVKERSKEAMGRAPDAPIVPLAGYFCAAAGALAHHGALICSRPRADLDAILVELAEASDEPWKALFRRAVAAPVPADPIFPVLPSLGSNPESV